MSEANVELVRRAYEAMGQRDWEAGLQYAHPEIEFHTYANSPVAGVYKGVDAVRAYHEDLFAQFESFSVEADEVIDAGDRVVVASTHHAVPKGGERQLEVRVFELWTIRDGLLAERRSYSTMEEALEAAEDGG